MKVAAAMAMTDDAVRLAGLTTRAGRRAKDHGGISSDSWCSPGEISVPLFELYGRPVGCDPCSNERSIIRARRTFTTGGLVRPWTDGGKDNDAYANWPYSQNEPWAAKGIAELAGDLSELVVLCMTATSTRWWKSLMHEPRRNPRVVATKRLKFLGPDGVAMDSSRFEPALIYYGKKTKKFDKEFRHVAMWSTWGR